VARNAAYRQGRGEFIICQSDDVVHVTEDSIDRLVQEIAIHSKSFVIATVFDCKPNGDPLMQYTGLKRQLPYFFLGIVRRKHLYAVGGNDESFLHVIGYEDQWFSDCLIRGLNLTAIYIDNVIGHHQHHDPRPDPEIRLASAAKLLYLSKVAEAEKNGVWTATGGPWDNDAERLEKESNE